MADTVLLVDGLSKHYQLGRLQRRPDTLRDRLLDLGSSLSEIGSGFNLFLRRSGSERPDEKFWALEDVSFDVQRGEVVGIIGRNGAGKSTLLKILSRITKPTRGRAEVHGRIGSLLEVGTGFHPELSGRENIYLNGAILGMRRTEIEQKFDEIVAFAEVEKFIDTPVKHYSSGMYVRLAFAVAAHLESEILLIDEVLAVGDAAFQKKCLGKMSDVANAGRTILFVSHNMGAIQQLCTRAVLLRNGRVVDDGLVEHVIGGYLSDASQSSTGVFDLSRHPARDPQSQMIFKRLTLSADDGVPKAVFYPDESFVAELLLEPQAKITQPRLAVAIEDNLGRRITTLASYFQPQTISDIEGACRARVRLEKLNLAPGFYLISVSLATKYGGLLDAIYAVAWFEVDWRNNFGTGENYLPVHGPVLMPSQWDISPWSIQAA
jgi:lipopolysaccharide transport system ATP-binding protein